MKKIFSIDTFYNNSKEDSPFSEAIHDYYINSNNLKLYVQEGYNNFFLNNFNVSSKEFVNKWKNFKPYVNRIFIGYDSGSLIGIELEFTTKSNSFILIQFIYDSIHNSYKLYKYSFKDKMEDPKDYDVITLDNKTLEEIKSRNEYPFKIVKILATDNNMNSLYIPYNTVVELSDDGEDKTLIELIEIVVGGIENIINFEMLKLDSIKQEISEIIYSNLDNKNFFTYDVELRSIKEYKKPNLNEIKVPSYIVRTIFKKACMKFADISGDILLQNRYKRLIKELLKLTKIKEPEIEIKGSNAIIPTYNNYKLIEVKDETIIVNNKYKFDVKDGMDDKHFFEIISSTLDDLRLNEKVMIWCEDVENALKIDDPVERKNKIDELHEFEKENLTEFEKKAGLYAEWKEKLDDCINTYSNIDFNKVYKIKYKVNALINSSTIDKTDEIEEVYSIFNKLNIDDIPYAQPYINELSDYIIDFLNKENNISEYRRVFIHKNAFDQYKKFDHNVKIEIEKIIKNLKTLSKFDLMKYLVSLQLNTPYNRINYKIRVGNINPYRICFWFGKDLIDRLETKNDIYIYHFVSSDHDEDIKKMKDMKPFKYQENDFTLFNKEQDKNRIYQPELKNKQFMVSSEKEGPMVIYGCAGSGKTSISIDQYFKLVKENPNYDIDDNGFIAYVTFIDGLKKNAAAYINTYEIKDKLFYY